MTINVQAQVSIASGANQTGGVIAAFGQSVALTGVNTTGWTSALWAIYDYPVGFTAPAGWSTDANGVIYYQPTNPTTPPPAFNLPASGANNWGKFAVRLSVNGNPLQRNSDGSLNAQYVSGLTDESLMIDVPSPVLGMHGIASNESAQYDKLRGWTGDVMQSLRKADQAIGGGGATFGTYANRPAAGISGRLYYGAQGDMIVPYIDDGANWRPLVNGIAGTEVAPANSLAAFTAYGTTATTSNATGGCAYLLKTSNGGSHSICGFEVARSAGQSVTACLFILCTPGAATAFASAGIYFRDSVGAKLQGINLTENQTNATPVDSTAFIQVDQWTSSSAFSANATKRYANFEGRGCPLWLRIRDDGSNMNYEFSLDGTNFNQQFQENTFLPRTTGNRFGYYADPDNQDVQLTLLSWKVG